MRDESPDNSRFINYNHHQYLSLQRPHECVRMTMSQTQAARADSIDGQDPHNEVQKKVKSRRPASTTTPSCYNGYLSDSPEADVGLLVNRYCFPATEIESMAVGAPSQSRVSTVS
jgi:hypothetical protein